jgi:hypothetical protein
MMNSRREIGMAGRKIAVAGLRVYRSEAASEDDLKDLNDLMSLLEPQTKAFPGAELESQAGIDLRPQSQLLWSLPEE